MTRLIKALPAPLCTCPAWVTTPDDPAWDDKKQAWRDWADGVIRYRYARKRSIEGDLLKQATELALCARDPVYWLLIWGWIFEPRPMRDRSPDSPFILFPFQIDLIDWFDERMETSGPQGDGVVSKSRDMGASWLAAAWSLHGWLFKDPWQIRIVSWRADEVDAKTPDSFFWKIDYLLSRLPKWMQPAGYTPDLYRTKMLLMNPVNGNALAGEASTSRAMSGGRATGVIYDEAAKNERFEESWSGVSNVTYHRLALSSEHLDYNDFFYRLVRGEGMQPEERPAVKEMDYWLHPMHDAEWLADQVLRNASTPGAFEREVLRNPRAGDTSFVYPGADEKQPMTIPYIDGAPMYLGIDPGHSDFTAVVWEQLHPDGRMKVMNAYQRRGMVADFWGTIIRGTPYIRTPTWSLDPQQRMWFDTGTINHLGPDALPTGWQVVGKGGIDEAGNELPTWTYTAEELAIMEWVRTTGQPICYGDTSGWATLGATKDTVYSRLMRFGITVNTDRNRDGKATSWRMQARTYKGRQEAMKDQLPRLDFGDSRGARMALAALKEYRWAVSDKPRASEPQTPLHNDASHLATALEYIAVNLYIRRRLVESPLAAPYQIGRSPHQRQGYRRG